MARVAFWARTKAIVAALAWIAGFVLVGGGATLLLGRAVTVPGASPWAIASGSACGVVGFGFATWLVGRVANRHAWAALGWAEPRRLVLRLAAGTGLGGGMALLAIGVSAAAGARLTWDGAAGPLRSVAALGLGLLLAALLEELVFRGYPLRRLAEATGPGVAMTLLAVGFGAAHARNPGASPLGVMNVALAACWLAVAFFSRGGLPLAWGLHFGWNAGLAGLEAPVSGYTFGGLSFVGYAPGPHRWLDGGAFGPEGGLVGTLAFVVGTAMIVGRRLPRPGEWFA